jgi:hypothetical protein
MRQDVPLRVLVRRADHLWEVDDDWIARLSSNQDIELVEIAVDEAGLREANNKVHESGVQLARRADVGNLTSAIKLARSGRRTVEGTTHKG